MLEDLLDSPSKGVETATGPLTVILRKMFIDLDITPQAWNTKVTRYINSNASGLNDKSRSIQSSFKSNLAKALFKPSITWDNFVSTIKVFNPKKANFLIKLEFSAKGDRPERVVDVNIDILKSDRMTLWRVHNELMSACDIDAVRWNNLVNEYRHRRLKESPYDAKELGHIKGNLDSKLRSKNLSIKNLMLVINILNPDITSLELIPTWAFNTTVHRCSYFGMQLPDSED